MRFIQVDETAAREALEAKLQTALVADNAVLWLVSGGSNLAAAVAIMAALPDELTPKLTIMPVDERFGAPGHADSNWQQLMAAGFAPKHAQLSPVLQPGQDFDGARDYFEVIAARAFEANDICIAQLGMGVDGHIAGILPHSAALNDTRLVCAYDSEPYARLTLTFSALQKVHEIYVFAFGEAKRSALLALQSQNLSPDEQPAQFLKQLPAVYLYNDQVGENI